MSTLRIAVIGSGIGGLSAAWLLSQRHRVTLLESAGRVGGHANTVDVDIDGRIVQVDTGFIVYNEPAYPNFSALLRHLRVETTPTCMTFAVSLDDGAYEYSGSGLHRLFGQLSNLSRYSQWRLTADIVRFFARAQQQVKLLAEDATLADLLKTFGYSEAFARCHLLPMAGAIWSAAPGRMASFPAAAFVSFFSNHGLLKLTKRPPWRTVRGGSRRYVEQLLATGNFEALTGVTIETVRRLPNGVTVAAKGYRDIFDHVVIATHADEALRILADADGQERQDLGAFGYSQNRAVLHTDPMLMPKRRKLWSSWNYLGNRGREDEVASVTYWMNSLQPLAAKSDIFVSLNPRREPAPGTLVREFGYEHPVYSVAAMAAQRRMWRLQGRRRTWFCGAHFGAGFHEDGLQAGLAVAEQLGGLRRPWHVPDESGRIHVRPAQLLQTAAIKESAE